MTAASNGSGFKESLTPKMFKVEAILGKGAFGEVSMAYPVEDKENPKMRPNRSIVCKRIDFTNHP